MAYYSAIYGTAIYGQSWYGVMVAELDSDSYIQKQLVQSLYSNANIKDTYSKTLNSDAYVLDTLSTTISSDGHILLTIEETLFSDARIVPGLVSNVFIKVAGITNTLASITVIAIPSDAEEFDMAWDDIAEEPEFTKVATYRRYNFYEDNNTGDRDRSEYTDYTIYCEVQIVEDMNKITKVGEPGIGDAVIFMPARLTTEYDGTAITNSFRPQIDDEIIRRGKTYIIKKLTFERVGQHEIFAECECRLVGSDNPAGVWNANYQDDRGWS